MVGAALPRLMKDDEVGRRSIEFTSIPPPRMISEVELFPRLRVNASNQPAKISRSSEEYWSVGGGLNQGWTVRR